MRPPSPQELRLPPPPTLELDLVDDIYQSARTTHVIDPSPEQTQTHTRAVASCPRTHTRNPLHPQPALVVRPSPSKNRNTARGGCTRPVTPYIPQIELEKGPARPFTSKVSSQTLFERRQIPYRARLLDAHDPSAYLGKAGRDTVIVDIASLLKSTDSNESPASPSQHTSAAPVPPTTAATAPRAGPPPSSFPLGPAVSSPRLGGRGGPPSLGAYGFPSLGPNLAHSSGSGSASRPGSGNSGKRSMPPHTSESPAKKQSKWSPEEDALIIELRGSGMKWDDISKRLPGRSSISCRLHYQNYLERRSEWDEERKNKLARLYERFKPEMWAKVAEEMQVPWRAAEAMHWQLGEQEMARRAGVIPFALNMTAPEQQHPGSQRVSPTRGHAHSQSQGSLPRDMAGMASPRYIGRGHPATSIIPPPGPPGGRPLAARRESVPPPRLGYPHHHSDPIDMSGGYGNMPSFGLAPIQTNHPPGRGGGLLPSVAELTTGVSPYSTPAYSVGGMPSASPVHSATASPGPLLPSMSSYAPLEPSSGKRRASPPDVGVSRETARRRQHLHPSRGHGPDEGEGSMRRGNGRGYR